MVGGRPGRGSSTSPSSRSAKNRRRHLRTVSAATRNSRATATIGGTSGPAHASTIRARRASAWADDDRRVHRSNTARSSPDSSNGSSFGPRRGTDAPAAEVTELLTINYWRRTLGQGEFEVQHAVGDGERDSGHVRKRTGHGVPDRRGGRAAPARMSVRASRGRWEATAADHPRTRQGDNSWERTGRWRSSAPTDTPGGSWWRTEGARTPPRPRRPRPGQAQGAGVRNGAVRNGPIRDHGVRNGGARNRNVHNPTRRPYRIRPRPRLHRPGPHRRGGRHQLRRPFRHDGGPRDRGGTPRGRPLCGRGGRDRGQPRHLRALRGTGPGIRGVDRPGDGLLRRPRRPAGHRRDGRLGHGRRGAHRVRAQQLAPHRRYPYGGRGLPGAAGPRPAHPLHRRAAGAPRRRLAHPGVALPRTAGPPHGDRGVHDGRRRHRTEPSDRPRSVPI